MATQKFHKIVGFIFDVQTDTPIPELRVQAWDCRHLRDDCVAQAVSDLDGRFEIPLRNTSYRNQNSNRENYPQIYFKVFKRNELLLDTYKRVQWSSRRGPKAVALYVQEPAKGKQFSDPIFRGVLRKTDGAPHKGVQIIAFNKSVKRETKIGETRTDQKGKYQIQFNNRQKKAYPEKVNLLIKAFNRKSKLLATSEIIYNANTHERVDLFEGDHPYPGKTIYEESIDSLKAYLQGVSLQDLSDKQVDFLVSSIDEPRVEYQNLIHAARLSKSIKIPEDILFALLEAGMPSTLPAILLQPPGTHRKAIESAIENNFIPLRSEKEIDAAIQVLRNLIVTNALKSAKKNAYSMDDLLKLVLPQKEHREEFVHDFVEHKGKTEEFWKYIEKSARYQKDAEKLLKVFQFAIITGNNVPLVEDLIKRQKTPIDVAGWTVDDWMTILKIPKISRAIPAVLNVSGRTNDKHRKQYASAIARMLNDEYPTASIFGRLSKSDFKWAGRVNRFYKQNSEFKLEGAPVSIYLSKHPKALNRIGEKEKFIASLKSLQRLYRVAPQYEQIERLYKDRLVSAHQIASKGFDEFVSKYRGRFGAFEAAQIWSRAHTRSDASMHLLFNHAPQSRIPIRAITGLESDGSQLPATPNPGSGLWETIFGDIALCECEHCDSMLSPSAYFADMLDFLDQRKALISEDEEGEPSVLDKLIVRRPDLAEIELTCKNANTLLPYVDLVIEILEEEVYTLVSESDAPPIPARQTSLSKEELAANPEHLIPEAYQELQTAVFPWSLPFDLFTEELRIYLGYMNVKQTDLIQQFRPLQEEDGAVYLDEDFAAKVLGLTQEERLIITGHNSDLTPPRSLYEYWGYPGPAIWVRKTSNVGTLLSRSGLSYDELISLLSTQFINPDELLRIVPDEDAVTSCNVSGLVISNFSVDGNGVPDRLHRFVRLWRKTGWDVFDLDAAITSLSPSFPDTPQRLNADMMIKLSHVKWLVDKFKQPVESVLAFWAKINAFEPPLPDPGVRRMCLYNRLFQNPAVTNPVDTSFELSDSGELEMLSSDSANAKISLHIPIVLAAICATAKELNALVDRGVVDDTLNRENLSALYRHVQLARCLKISIEDLLLMIELTNIDPFDIDNTHQTIVFVQKALAIKRYPIPLDEINYILRHKTKPVAGLEPFEEAHQQILETIRSGCKRINMETALPSPEEITADFLKKSFSFVLEASLLEDAVRVVLEDEDWGPLNERRQFIEDHFSIFADNIGEARTKLAGSPGYIIPFSDTVARIEYVLLRLLPYIRKEQSTAHVKQVITDGFELKAEMASSLLAEWLVSISAPPEKALSDFLDSSFIDSDETERPTTPALFASQFNQLARIEKISLLSNRLGISKAILAYVLEEGTGSGWLDLQKLPYEDDPSDALPFESMEKLISLIQLSRKIPGGPEELVKLFKLAKESGTTEDDLINSLSEITEWDVRDLEYLCGPDVLAAQFPDDYQDECVYIRLNQIMRTLFNLGVSAAQAREWIENDIDETKAAAAKRTVAAKYSEEDWLKRAKPLRDKLREKQRAALVTYLLHSPLAAQNQWENENHLYAYYLIDVEMTPCMETSRIKQATLSVQLFAQRCLMNLERANGIRADIDFDREWSRWPLYKNYRIWEANRKIFMWPENYIRSEWRDDKTPFFKELEDYLLQTEVTPEAVEEGLQVYLDKLDAIAGLEVVSYFHQQVSDDLGQPAVDRLHVIARTEGTPHTYYYRYCDDCSSPAMVWSAWEKLPLDIQGNHVTTVIWNRRLHLFWLFFSDATDHESRESEDDPLIRKSKIQLFSSEYSNGQWSAPVLSEDSIEYYPCQINSKTDIQIYTIFEDGDLKILIDHKIWAGSYKFAIESFASFEFNRCRTNPTHRYLDSAEDKKATPYNTEPFGNRLIEHTTEDTDLHCLAGEELTYILNKLILLQGQVIYIPSSDYPPHFIDLVEVPVFNSTPGRFSLVYPHQDPQFNSTRPFFYFDRRCRFFVIPDVRHIPIGFPRIEDIFTRYLSSEVPGIRRVRTAGVTSSNPGTNDPTLGPSTARFRRTYPVEDEYAHIYGGGVNIVGATGARPHGGSFNVIEAESFLYSQLRSDYTFYSFYHPYVCTFKRELRKNGIDGLLQRKIQTNPHELTKALAEFDFPTDYDPQDVVLEPYPEENVDFSPTGAYSAYNWELFFHVPLLIAEQLSKNQKFEEARKWFHYIFNPTLNVSDDSIPKRYWIMGHFYNTTSQEYEDQAVEEIIQRLAEDRADENLSAAISAWRKNPFNPYVVARLRTTAFQKAVIMKYIDNLVSWADQLVRRARDPEQINEATQLYLLADELLGEEPVIISPRAYPIPLTYSDISLPGEDSTGGLFNVMLELEQFVSPMLYTAVDAEDSPGPIISGPLFYFCIPHNAQLLDYWKDLRLRLSNLRRCLDVEGRKLALPLYEPPIPPELLIKARAAGLDISSVLADLNTPLGPYRFQTMVKKALEICAEVKSLGQVLLSALEKKDAEALSLLRSSHELQLLDAATFVKKKQIDEAEEQLAGLKKYEELVATKRDYYEGLIHDGPLVSEERQINSLAMAIGMDAGRGIMAAVAGALHLVPDTKAGLPSTAGATHGGSNIGSSISTYGGMFGALSSIFSTVATIAGITSSRARQKQEWEHQLELAETEIEQAAKQSLTAKIRLAIYKLELTNHIKQITQAKETDDFLNTKFTNKQLYDWMVTQISGTYFQSYQLAYDMAKRAEQAFRYELGLEDTDYVSFGYWDSLKKGLLSGEKLYHDIQRLEVAFLDQNRREYELTKHVSLALTNPRALVELRENGICTLKLDEYLYDLDHAGHYMRRIKSISLSIPVVTGPYTGVHAKLSLVSSMIRKNASLTGGTDYPESYPDDRFKYMYGTAHSIATSSSANDAGLFELNFHDERYLPFEGHGAISEWQLELDKEMNRFDFKTLADVVLHINYTARDGGVDLKSAAKTSLPKSGATIFSLRHEFSTEWNRFITPPETFQGNEIIIDLREKFPYHHLGVDPKINSVELFLKLKYLPEGTPTNFPVRLYDVPTDGTDLMGGSLSDPGKVGLYQVASDLFEPAMDTGEWRLYFSGTKIPDELADTNTIDGTTYKYFKRDIIEDIYLLCHYSRT